MTNPDAEWVEAKLDEQAAIIRALDAQIDAQRKSGEIRRRRKEDQAFR